MYNNKKYNFKNVVFRKIDYFVLSTFIRINLYIHTSILPSLHIKLIHFNFRIEFIGMVPIVAWGGGWRSSSPFFFI